MSLNARGKKSYTLKMLCYKLELYTLEVMFITPKGITGCFLLYVCLLLSVLQCVFVLPHQLDTLQSEGLSLQRHKYCTSAEQSQRAERAQSSEYSCSQKVLAEKGFPLVTDCSCEDTWLITAPRRQEMESVFIEDVDTFIFKLFDINLNYCYYDLVYNFL